MLLSQTQPQAISNITMNLTSANIHAAAEAHSYNGLLSVLEGLPLTNDSRGKILFVLQHYEQYVRLICNSLRSAVGLIEANPQLYAYALKDFEHDYSDISDIIEVIEDENGTVLPDVPKTGDTSRLAAYIILMCCSASSLLVLFFAGRKRKDDR